MADLKFIYNWNNKLECNYFTTIRLASTENIRFYDEGKDFNIFLKGKPIGSACIVKTRVSPLSFIDTEILMCDVGYSKQTFFDIVQKMYKIPTDKLDDTKFLIITLKKNK